MRPSPETLRRSDRRMTSLLARSGIYASSTGTLGDADLPGFTLVLNETFPGTLDTSLWDVEVGTYGQGGTTNRVGRWATSNVQVSAANTGGTGNSLKLRSSNNQTGTDGGATSRWIGGMVSTRAKSRFFPRYGRYEIRARLHHGQGVWPAFWLRHRDGSSTCEVDIMEYFHGQLPGHTVGVLHRTPGSNPSGGVQENVNLSPRYTMFETPVAEGSQGWHTFGCTIKPNSSDPNHVNFEWYVNNPDNPFETYTDMDAGFWRDLYTSQAFDITLQGAQIGGRWAGHPNDELGFSRDNNACMIGGSPGSCTKTFGGKSMRRSEIADVASGGQAATVLAMEVDYVRVWEYTP